MAVSPVLLALRCNTTGTVEMASNLQVLCCSKIVTLCYVQFVKCICWKDYACAVFFAIQCACVHAWCERGIETEGSVHVNVSEAEVVTAIQAAAIECDDFQMAVLMNWVECKKHKKLRSISSTMPFNIRVLLLKN